MHSTFQKFALSAAVAAAAFAVTAGPVAHSQVLAAGARPTLRLTEKVDNAVTTRVAGSHPQLAQGAVLGAKLSATQTLPHLRLMLSSSDDQLAALHTLMAEQQDKSSPNFHKWLTPETFGQNFGPASADVAKVTAWLQDQGMSVESVSKSNRIITFTGDVAQVESAFHTEMHSVTLNGEEHIANTSDIAIPAALAPVVKGIARLNDFFPRSHPFNSHTIQIDSNGNQGPAPLYGNATSTHYVTPGDAAIIYNTTPLTSATTPIDGTGQTIAIIAQSNIDVADVQKFRSMFGLPKKDPVITVIGQDPGLNGDDGEAYLDAEWGGAMGYNANVTFLVSGPSLAAGGIDASALYAVENNIADIISLSYGGCEYNNGQAYTAFWNSIWEQAAAQGQTAFVSTGDSGAAGCTSSSATYAGQYTNGTYYSVNSLGSSAYNVAVGGSLFVDFGQTQYWGANGVAIPFVNALSYIPETPLNQSRLAPNYMGTSTTAYQTGSGVFAGGGGVSLYTPRPAWQTGSGIPTNVDTISMYGTSTGIVPYTNDGSHRLVPDVVSISANGHDGTLYCASSLCSTTSTGALNNAGVVGGTSVATPVQASMQALINQKNGGRQGNVLPYYYKLANAQYTASTTACQATLGTNAVPAVTLPASTCNFHDVVTGSITVPNTSSGTNGTGYLAAVGFDEASGLGSMNVANVANNWSSISLSASTTTFTLSPTAAVTHGATQSLTVNVKSTSGTGTPTGDVSLVAEIASAGGPRTYTLTSGTYTGTVAGSTILYDGSSPTLTAALPAGNYNVHVHYGGDLNFAASDSASVPVSIVKESASVATGLYTAVYSGGYSFPAASSFVYGAPVYIDTDVTGTSGAGTPTGTITYTLTQNATNLTPLTVSLDSVGNAYLLAGGNVPAYYLKTNYTTLSPGSYTATIAYSGDSTFAATSTTASFTVTQLTPTVTFTVPTNITSGATAVFGYKITVPTSTQVVSTAGNAIGTVTFTDTTTAQTLGTCTLSAGVCSFSTTAITAAGANSIQATYSGDANYATATNTGSVTVGTLTAPTLTLTGTATSVAAVGYVYTLKATMNPTAATGTVSFFDSNTFLGSCTLASGICTLALGNTATSATGTGGILTAGTHSFSATYSGSATYSSSSGTLSTNIAQGVITVTPSGPANTTYGQPVVISAYLSKGATGTSTAANTNNPPTIPLTGTLTVSEGATLLASGTPIYDIGGYHYYIAAATINTLTGGSHTLTVAYSGDANFAASTATLTVPVTVAPLTPTIVLSTTTGSTSYATGSPVFLQAVIPLSSTLAAPTSAVTFTESGTNATYTSTLSYSAAIGGYVATVGLNGLKGTHTYTASITADTNYNTATSNTLTVLVLTNNVWVANGNGTVSGISEAGAAVTGGGVAGGGTAIAIDNSGNIWSLNKSGSAVAEYSNTGTILSLGGTVGGLNAPTALAIDGAGLVWVTNSNSTLSVLSAPSTAVTPASGYKTSSSTPTSLNIDASGNLWITSSGDNTVTEVVGAATPVTTPTSNAVKTNTLAVKP